jgi:hypothetical protein
MIALEHDNVPTSRGGLLKRLGQVGLVGPDEGVRDLGLVTAAERGGNRGELPPRGGQMRAAVIHAEEGPTGLDDEAEVLARAARCVEHAGVRREHREEALHEAPMIVLDLAPCGVEEVVDGLLVLLVW